MEVCRLVDWPTHVTVKVRKIAGGRPQDLADAVVVEHHFTVEFRGRPVARVACTPERLDELAAGLLIGQGLLPVPGDPATAGFGVSFSPDRRLARVEAWVHGGTGEVARDGQAAAPRPPCVEWEGRLSPAWLAGLARTLEDAPLFRLTGGAHSAVAAGLERDPGTLRGSATADGGALCRREDIGRHNAIDKVIGWLWLGGRLAGADPLGPPTGRAFTPPFILATSGRLFSDIVLKAARARFPVVVSPGAPTAMAVDLASELGLTLVGFARGDRLNVYSHAERVG
jgi:FdhD protein